MIPKISIITPSLNQGKYIEKAILSVIEQGYENLEYIIIDGGSTDNTLEIIRKYESRITYFVSEPDLGQTDAINKGLLVATGDIFAWINADDFYEDGALHKVSQAFITNPENDVFCGKATILNSDGKIQRESHGVVLYQNLARTIGWPVINQPETFFRRSIFEKIGSLSTDLKYNMDKELWIKYLLVYGQQRVFKTDEILANFRLHENSKSMAETAKFTPERDAILLGVMQWAGLTDEADFLNEKLNMKSFNYSFRLEVKPDVNFIRHVFQYFILLKSDEYYVEGDYKRMKLCLNKLDPMEIQESILLYIKLSIKKLFC